jgi:hypothetical protein
MHEAVIVSSSVPNLPHLTTSPDAPITALLSDVTHISDVDLESSPKVLDGTRVWRSQILNGEWA